MAELVDVSLKLLFTAENNAQTVINTLVGSMKDLLEELRAFEDLNPFAQWAKDADTADESIQSVTESVNTLKEAAQSMADTMKAAMTQSATTVQRTMSRATQDAAAQAAAMEERVTRYWAQIAANATEEMDSIAAQARLITNSIADTYAGLSDKIRAQMQAAAEESMRISVEAGDTWETAMQGAAAAVQDLAANLGLVPSKFSPLIDEAQQLNETLAQTADEARAVADQVTAATQGAGGGSSLLEGGHGPGLLHQLFFGGMNAMMGYYALQSLGTAGMQFVNIEQMQKLNGQTPQEAAQALMMLGSVGLTGSSATEFLSNLKGQLAQALRPQVGTGQISQTGVFLSQLGINQQTVAQTPWTLLGTIAARYDQFMAKGDTYNATQLLSLTGTTNLAPMFQNWGALYQQTENVLPGMTSKQVQAAAKEGLQMEVALQKLALAFDQLAVALLPLVQPLVNAFASVVKFFTSGSTELGRIAGVLAGIATTLAAINLAKLLLGKTVPLMRVTAGVVNVAGGVPPAAASAEGAAATDVTAGVEGGAMAEGGVLAGVLASVRGAFGALARVLSPLVDLVGTRLVGAWTAISGILGTVAEVVGGALFAALDAIGAPIELIIGALAAVGFGIYELIAHWRTVTAWLSRLGGDFVRWASQTGATVGQWTVKTALDFNKWSGQVEKELAQWTVKTGAAFLKWSGQTLTSFGQWVSRTTASFLQWASHTGSAFLHWAGQTGHTLAQWAGEGVQVLQTWAQQTGSVISQWTQSVAQWVSNMVSTLSSMVSAAGNMIKNIGSSIGNWVSNTVQSVGQTISQSLFGGGQGPVMQAVHLPGNAVNWIQQAMKDAGVSGSQWLTGLEAMVQHESGGNPNAVNPVGINPVTGQIMRQGGEHATGIAQMLMSTFQAYMKPGMNNILNPVDNLVASIRYIQARYGGIVGMEQASGLLSGHYRGYASGGVIREPVAGIGLNTGSHYLMGEAGPEMVVPLSGLRGGGSSLTVNVQVQAANPDHRALAQQVASEIVQQLKRRANLAWGVR